MSLQLKKISSAESHTNTTLGSTKIIGNPGQLHTSCQSYRLLSQESYRHMHILWTTSEHGDTYVVPLLMAVRCLKTYLKTVCAPSVVRYRYFNPRHYNTIAERLWEARLYDNETVKCVSREYKRLIRRVNDVCSVCFLTRDKWCEARHTSPRRDLHKRSRAIWWEKWIRERGTYHIRSMRSSPTI